MKKEMLAMILAGGQGSRLGVFTKRIAKPAVSFGGKYRIIDFVLSNMANSGIEDIAIFTENKSRSLVEHLTNGRPWDLDRKKMVLEYLILEIITQILMMCIIL